MSSARRRGGCELGEDLREKSAIILMHIVADYALLARNRIDDIGHIARSMRRSKLGNTSAKFITPLG